jgi:hypothetical protein
LDQEQKTLRIVRIASVLAALAYFWVEHTIKPKGGAPPEPIFYESIAAIAIVDGFLGILIQKILLKVPARPLPNGKVPTAAQRWFTASIVRLAFAMSTCLFGLVLHMLLAPERLAQGLMLAGVLFLMVPLGKPPADDPTYSPYGGTIG